MKKIKLLILVSVLFNPMVVLSQMTPREIYQKNVNSVVLIITKNKDGSKSKGTGAVIGDSRVITNAHVVLEEGDQLPEKILIFLREDNINDESDKSYRRGRSGRIIRFDSDLDLALLEVKGIKSVQPIYLSDSEGVMVGDPVLAIGHPESGGLWSLTSGRIGSVIKNQSGIRGKHVFQTETSLNRGNSGGPLLDGNGEMVGVNTNISRRSSDGLAITGINFAVQSNVVRSWLEEGGLSVTSNKNKQSSKTTAGIKKKEKDTPEIKRESPEMESLPDNTLLTPLRPFNEKDLFEMFKDEEDDGFDKIMESQMDDMDKMMDDSFDKF
jgi:serine protease Do